MANKMLGLIGTSFGLIALYLILDEAGGASQVIGALGSTYVDSVFALQGRDLPNRANTRVRGVMV